MVKKYITKPESVSALYFDGTVESAREISSWVKEVIGELSYINTQMRDRRERSSFGSIEPHMVNDSKELYIYTHTWGTIEVYSGSWLLFDEERWFSASDNWFNNKYQEVEGN